MDQDYQFFIARIKSQTGIDLAFYKEAQMKRRLTSLREKKGYKSFQDYYSAMTVNKNLLAEFLEKMTINVSEFYRNPTRWEVLESQILPKLLESKKTIKAWSAACSTGEEPYTLSMILHHSLRKDAYSIDATDIDDRALQSAERGHYAEKALQEVPEHFKKFYFKQEGIGYKIDERLKENITFRKQNLLLDRFQSGFDLIICRNVLIYFTEEAKTQLYQKFSQALRPGGVLFVGSTEQIFNPKQYGFRSIATFFYEKIDGNLSG